MKLSFGISLRGGLWQGSLKCYCGEAGELFSSSGCFVKEMKKKNLWLCDFLCSKGSSSFMLLSILMPLLYPVCRQDFVTSYRFTIKLRISLDPWTIRSTVLYIQWNLRENDDSWQVLMCKLQCPSHYTCFKSFSSNFYSGNLNVNIHFLQILDGVLLSVYHYRYNTAMGESSISWITSKLV